MADINNQVKSMDKTVDRLRDAIEKKYGKSVEDLYNERLTRFRETIALQEPDRIPVPLGMGVFASRYAGLTTSAMFYNHSAFKAACLKTILEFEPDLCCSLGGASSGLVLDLLEIKQQMWPGGNLPDDIPPQFVEGEYMKMEEYGLFLSDTSDFVLRYYLPRVFGIFEPLVDLPPLRSVLSGGEFVNYTRILSQPAFRNIARKLSKAGREQEKLKKQMSRFVSKIIRLGFPVEQFGRGIGSAPFDTISDYLRGMRGTMLDMYRCPENLLASCDKILEWRMAQSSPGQPENWLVSQGMPLHRGSDGFMSLKQFEKFYWPTLKKAIKFNVDNGYIVWLYCEGIWDNRLEYLLELPKGKVVCVFMGTDIFKAKEIIGKHLCIQATVPSSLLQLGSSSDVAEYCQKLIKICGRGGGFILDPGSPTNDAKPENIRAIIDSVKKPVY
jgi:uroporphyrinogen-III decarboxylase